MPEYLAPGVFVEETSYRSKSIEGVGTTTTGFVGPSRFGPIDLTPEVVTSVTEFERAYGDGAQLDFGNGVVLHNYLWHGVRAFFEEGGRRLYIARAFRPRVDPEDKGYVTPAPELAEDKAAMSGGIYGADGHARCWLTEAGRAFAVARRGFEALLNGAKALAAETQKAVNDAEAEAGRETGSHADDATLQRVQRVGTALGLATMGSETGLCLALAQAKEQAAAAKAAFPASVLDYAPVGTAVTALRTAIDLASAPAAALALETVITPAADAVAAAATQARDATAELGTAAAAVQADAEASTELKAVAGELQAQCAAADGGTSAGAARLAFEASATAATALKTAATPVDGATVDRDDVGEKAAIVVDKARLAKKQADLLVLASQRIAAGAVADGVSNLTLLEKLGLVAGRSTAMAAAAEAARLAAQRSDYPRAFAVQDVKKHCELLQAELKKVEEQAAATMQELNAAPTPPTVLAGAVLLRARFPGAAGNVTLRVSARLGQNVIVADPDDAAKCKLRGVLENDLVRIGLLKPDSAATDTGKLYLARRDPVLGDWYFSPDGVQANAKFWLNTDNATRLDVKLHEVAIVTAGVELTSADRTRNEAWAGLAFHPGHRRNGAANAVTDKFSWSPSNGADARTLAVAMLLASDLKTGPQVFAALLQRDAAEVTVVGLWPLSQSYTLAGGNDGQRPGAKEYKGRGDGPDAAKTGLKAFDGIDDMAIVAEPGSTDGYEDSDDQRSQASQIIADLISHAERLRYRVAVLDSGNRQTVGQVRAMRARFDTKYAAMYYPWVKVRDPITDAEIDLPPSGFVAGIYARNDIERAVYKAPANEVVRGAIGFETLLNKAQQEVLNPEGVNCFRFFEGRGFRLWGARTASSDPEWKYISVRRYFAYLEHSIDRGTQWAVFEPNGDRLWANVRETVVDFLYNEWRNGALLGTQAEKAFFVKCDRSTMTQNDIDNGRLVCQIGVAVIMPAEFVIFRIGQWTADRKS